MRISKLLLSFALLAALGASGEDLSVLGQDAAPHDMLRIWLTKIAKQQLARRQAEMERIRSVPDFEKRRQLIYTKLTGMIGQLPSTKSPLNVQKLGTLDRGDYTVEKVIYES